MTKNITDLVMTRKLDYLSDNGKEILEKKLPVGTKIYIYSSHCTSAPLRTWTVVAYIKAPHYAKPHDKQTTDGWLCMCEETDSADVKFGFQPLVWSLGVIKGEVDGFIEDRQAVNRMHGSAMVSIPKYYFYAV